MRSSNDAIQWKAAVAAAGVVALSLSCVGEVGSLSGSPCESDLDCPGAYTCAQVSMDGRRSCQSLTGEGPVLDQNGQPTVPKGTPYYCDEVKPLFDQYCNACHGENRTASGVQNMRFDMWTNDPNGPRGAHDAAARIRVRTSDFKDMPPKSYSTQPTADERDAIFRWEQAGAPNCQDNPFPPVDVGGGGGGGGTGEDGGTVTPPGGMDAGSMPTPVSYSQQIQPIWNLYCTGCHQPGNAKGGVDLTAANSYAQIVNNPASCNGAIDEIEPGNPQSSMLYRKISADPQRCNGTMPTQDALSTFDLAAVQLVEQWIKEGAKNN